MQTITVQINRRRQINAMNGREKLNYKQLFRQWTQSFIRTTTSAELSMFAGKER